MCIRDRIDTFRKSGFQVDAVYRKDVHKLVVHNGSEEILISDKLKAPYKIASSKYLRYFLKDKQYDAAYIRYVFDDYQFHKLLKLLHSKNISVVVEIPTYPYDEMCIRDRGRDHPRQLYGGRTGSHRQPE